MCIDTVDAQCRERWAALNSWSKCILWYPERKQLYTERCCIGYSRLWNSFHLFTLETQSFIRWLFLWTLECRTSYRSHHSLLSRSTKSRWIGFFGGGLQITSNIFKPFQHWKEARHQVLQQVLQPSQNAQFLQFLLRIIPGHIDPNPHCAMGDSEPTLLADVQHYKEHYKDTWHQLALLRGFQGSRFPGFLTVSLAFSRCHPTISIQKISLEHIRTPAIRLTPRICSMRWRSYVSFQKRMSQNSD